LRGRKQNLRRHPNYPTSSYNDDSTINSTPVKMRRSFSTLVLAALAIKQAAATPLSHVHMRKNEFP
jgi:hypothetical protein